MEETFLKGWANNFSVPLMGLEAVSTLVSGFQPPLLPNNAAAHTRGVASEIPLRETGLRLGKATVINLQQPTLAPLSDGFPG